jgi:hypothetical protein
VLTQLPWLKVVLCDWQDDYNQVEAMAKDRQKEVETLCEELVSVRAQLSDKLKVINYIAPC